MKITKRQLQRIIREMHPRSAADDAYVAELEDKEEELATQIRHASKDIYGTKDHYDLRGKSIEELEDILYDLANSQEQRYLDDEARTEIEDEMGYDSELSRTEMAPRRQGMSRRPRGSKSQRRMESKVKVTKNLLQKIIREELGMDMPLPSLDLDYTMPEEKPRDMGHGGSAKMAKGQLFHIAKNSQSLHDQLMDEDQLPEWAQSKIAVIKSMLDAVHDHLNYKIHRNENE
tara:strand:+ start:1756 stop:2448 length:693 start_codon:yes stop_codon:yes gene_type:complete